MEKTVSIESLQLEMKQVTPDDFPAVYKFIKEYFFETEPIQSYLYKTEAKDFRYIDRCERVLTIIKDQTSVLLKDQLGEIVAVALSGCVSNIPKKASEAINPIYTKVKNIVLSAKEGSDKVLDLNENEKEMFLRVLCTHPKWTKRGLGKFLVEETIAVAKNNGFTNIRAFCTSAYSANALEKCGFKCIYQIKYENYTENGKVVFKLPAPHFELKVMNIKL